MVKTLLSPLNTFIIPELKPERKLPELLKKWRNIPKKTIQDQIEAGTKHEQLEHTPFRHIARIIASHHIYEDAFYYPKLAKWHKG